MATFAGLIRRIKAATFAAPKVTATASDAEPDGNAPIVGLNSEVYEEKSAKEKNLGKDVVDDRAESNENAPIGEPKAVTYEQKLEKEKNIYKDVVDVNELPPIFHYWSNKYLRPIFEEYGFSSSDEFFATYLLESARRCAAQNPVFVSIGSGNCDAEVRIAQILLKAGLTNFTIECVDMNPHMLQRGREMADREGVAERIAFVESDFNTWKAPRKYAGIMANQSLHHVLNLEGLFDEIKGSLLPRAYFITHDMIGRNGHQRWPEALDAVHQFWQELPESYRFNRLLNRHEDLYINWDCSSESFEGIRAQDILPLLLERFEFRLFIGFANIVDVFIERCFGHNFDAEQEWDRKFVDRLHEFDERSFHDGTLKPTHMAAVMSVEPVSDHVYSRGLSPQQSVRAPN
jgi:SAM-dependent methyltransferase